MADDKSESMDRAERLGDLFDGREEWAPPSEVAKPSALKDGLVVLDTNVLLHLYRFGQEARQELMDVLELLGERLFIPAQVAQEFLRRRLKVAMDVRKELQDGADQAAKSLEQIGKDLRSLGRHRGLSNAQQASLTEALNSAEQAVRKLLDDAIADRAWADKPASPDPLLPGIATLLAGKVGRSYSEAQMTIHRGEAERRVKEQVPPGWKDAKKDDPSGDYLLWRQTLDEAAVRKLPIFLVSDDVKEDWYQREGGLTVGPLPALIREAKDAAGVDLFMSDVAGFLFLAREALSATVSEETIEEAKRPPEVQAADTGATWTLPIQSQIYANHLQDYFKNARFQPSIDWDAYSELLRAPVQMELGKTLQDVSSNYTIRYEPKVYRLIEGTIPHTDDQGPSDEVAIDKPDKQNADVEAESGVAGEDNT